VARLCILFAKKAQFEAVLKYKKANFPWSTNIILNLLRNLQIAISEKMLSFLGMKLNVVVIIKSYNRNRPWRPIGL
jgi:hypothetical protein